MIVLIPSFCSLQWLAKSFACITAHKTEINKELLALSLKDRMNEILNFVLSFAYTHFENHLLLFARLSKYLVERYNARSSNRRTERLAPNKGIIRLAG